MLDAAEDDLVAADGMLAVRGDPQSAVSLAEFARAAAPASGYLRPGEPAGLAARRRFDVTHMTYPYGVHIAVAEVDPGTGEVRVLRYLVAYEVGRAVNPALVEGQLRGGVAQGIGGSLLEEFSYDETGQPQAVTFMDYRMPTAAEIPPIDVLVTQQAPAPGNPLGVMGAGEGGISAAGAAVASAVRAALGLAGSVGRLPLTPARVVALAGSAETPYLGAGPAGGGPGTGAGSGVAVGRGDAAGPRTAAETGAAAGPGAAAGLSGAARPGAEAGMSPRAGQHHVPSAGGDPCDPHR
jgi:carbon-monoxide dehydrogenase large subunit/6-hydroxypseudooxynicotine dehydrogenase subunit gamma